jgi:galactonate dehydratase
VCGQPVHQMLGGLCRPKQPIDNTCAGYQYTNAADIKPVATWNFSDAAGPHENLRGFMTRADAVAESLLGDGITAM